MRVLFVNDTSGFHCGSRAACEVITAGVLARGHELLPEGSKQKVDHDGVESCDAVLVNGEGTLHDRSPRSLRILQLLELAQSSGKATAICNASWFAMGNEHDHVLRKLDQLEVRESLSQEELRARHGVASRLCLDASYFHPQRPRAGAAVPARIRMTDLYWPGLRGFARPTGGPLSRFEFLKMDELDWQTMLDRVGASEILLTGRHHGVYAACRARVPFVALAGNTPKIEGLAAWSGLRLPVTRDVEALGGLLAGIHRFRGEFEALFDWMEQQPPWTCPF